MIRAQASIALIVASLVIAVGADDAGAYCPLDSRWPNGQITMSHNFPPTGPLLNGTASWAQNAESAMQEWSAVASDFRFIDGGPSGAAENNRDEVNNMVFGDSAGGDPFEGDVLALTLTRTRADGTALESDIVINRGANWNAYDGPIRVGADGAPVFDFRRVVLHELGHVLGLDHPDDGCGQTVEAIMNAQTTDLDRLTMDDRNGLSFIYSGGNQPPIADAGTNQQGDGTQPFVLNGGGSRDADGFIVAYDWTLDGELLARGRVAEVALRRGIYDIRLTVTDDDGASASDTVTIYVGSEFAPPRANNERPVAQAGDDQTVQAGRPIVLNGSASFDPDGVLDRFVWAFGHTVLGREPEIHVSLPAGVHEITLVVYDEAGDSDSDTAIITVLGGDAPMDEVSAAAEDPPVSASSPQEPSPGGASPCGAIGLLPLLAMGGWVVATPIIGHRKPSRGKTGRHWWCKTPPSHRRCPSQE